MTIRFASARVAVAAFFAACAGSAFAQQTVVTNGDVTVHNPNGTTTRVTRSGIVTTSRTRHQVSHHRAPRRVRVETVVTDASNVSLSGNGRKTTVNPHGGTVTINGNANRVTITGTCRRLIANGNNNFVLAERVGIIETPGNQNTVVWRRASSGTSPGVTNMGSHNSITHKP